MASNDSCCEPLTRSPQTSGHTGTIWISSRKAYSWFSTQISDLLPEAVVRAHPEHGHQTALHGGAKGIPLGRQSITYTTHWESHMQAFNNICHIWDNWPGNVESFDIKSLKWKTIFTHSCKYSRGTYGIKNILFAAAGTLASTLQATTSLMKSHTCFISTCHKVWWTTSAQKWTVSLNTSILLVSPLNLESVGALYS